MFQTIVDGERSVEAHDQHSQANAQGGSERDRVRSFQNFDFTLKSSIKSQHSSNV